MSTPITFQGGQALPTYGTPAYAALQAAQKSGQGGAANFNPTTGALSVGGQNLSVQPGSTLSTLSKTTNTAANLPSSSSTSVLNSNGQAAINGTTQAPTDNKDNTAQKWADSVNKTQGLNINASDIQALIDLGVDPQDAADKVALIAQNKKDTQTAKDQQDQIYRNDLASTNAQYAAANAKLTQERQNAIDIGVAQAAKNGLFEGQNFDQTAMSTGIGKQYDQLQVQLDAQAEAARNALASGNAKAYAQIQDNMANSLQTGLANIANNIQSMTKQAQTVKQNAAVIANDAATQYRNTLTQLPLTTADQMSSLPADVGQMTPTQLNDFQGTTSYQQGHAAGLSDQAILNDLRGLSQSGNFKQQTQTLNTEKAATAAQNAAASAQIANARLALAQANFVDKQSAQLDASTLGSVDWGKDILSAFQVSSPGHSKQENTDFLSSAASFATSGQSEYARQALTNYVFSSQPASTKTIIGGLQQVASYASSLKTKIMALPKDQQTGFLTGNFQEIATKFGTNPNPQLQELGAEFGHLALIYKANVFGKRALVSSDTTLKNLFPTITDSASLNWSTLNGMIDTANATLDSTVSSSIGNDLFSKIYPNGVIGGSAKTTSTSTSAPTPYGTVNGKPVYQHSDGKLYPTP